jgi:hypothetical protein
VKPITGRKKETTHRTKFPSLGTRAEKKRSEEAAAAATCIRPATGEKDGRNLK